MNSPKFNPHKYRAIISDFDGTLVDSTRIVDPKLIPVISKFTQTGRIFSLSTGVPYHGAFKTACETLSLIHPVSASGGCLIINPQNHQILDSYFIDPTTTISLFDFLSQNKLQFVIESTNRVYCHGFNPNTDSRHGLKVSSFSQVLDDSVVRTVVLLTDHSQSDLVLKKLTDTFHCLHIIKSKNALGEPRIDISHQSASKHFSLLKIAQMVNLTQDQIVGVGDGYNDFPLLTASGFKVTTEDAPDELKQIADLIIPPATELGMLKLLDLF